MSCILRRRFTIIINNQGRNFSCSKSPFCKMKLHRDEVPHYFHFHPNFHDENMRSLLLKDLNVFEDFINLNEETSLFQEVEPVVSRLKYETNHWDGAIAGYRETEKLKWSEGNAEVLNRVKKLAFSDGTNPLRYVHVLDLKDTGVIKPHIDSVRFCGSTIAGISLLSDSVMRLQHEHDKEKVVDILLRRCSLYVLTGVARYHFTHEILGNENSSFGSNLIQKTRRISIICRNEPKQE